MSYTESIRLFQESGQQRGLPFVMWRLGEIELKEEHYHQAEAFFWESLTLFEAHENRRGIVFVLEAYALLAINQKEYERGIFLYAAADNTILALFSDKLEGTARSEGKW